MKITEPGIYDITEADYHADPCPEPSLSNSIAKIMATESPLHAWFKHPRLNPHYESEKKSTFDLGSIAHDLLLGQDDNFVTVDADDWRTKAAKERRDEIRDAGQIPILEKDMAETQIMVDAAKRQLALHEVGPYFLEPNGTSEQTLVWKDKGVWCRARVDRMTPARTILFDYKTTTGSAHPDYWGTRSMFSLGYDMQQAFYSRGARILFDQDVSFFFVVQERSAPYALSVIANSPLGEEVGNARVETALTDWAFWLGKDAWPGYPRRAAYVDPPVWLQNMWLEEPSQRRSTVTEDMKALAREFQKPIED